MLKVNFNTHQRDGFPVSFSLLYPFYLINFWWQRRNKRRQEAAEVRRGNSTEKRRSTRDRFEGGCGEGRGGRGRCRGGSANSLKRHFSKFRCRSISNGEVHGRTYPWDFAKPKGRWKSFPTKITRHIIAYMKRSYYFRWVTSHACYA